MQVHQYLVADVIPKEAMGTFIGLFHAIGAVGGFIFNRRIVGYAGTDVQWVYAGCAKLYAGVFFLLVWRVREGEYPLVCGRGILRRKDHVSVPDPSRSPRL
jgi:sugar phosphate permease